jgi:hypothetical protein
MSAPNVAAMPTLAELAAKYGTDKSAHGYLSAYEMHFLGRRQRVQRLLEIGIGGYANPDKGGASLRMWRDYFPSAHIVGLDVNAKRFDPGERVTLVQGSQTDEALLGTLAEEYGPFDLVIDDGSHVNAQRNLTFRLLFPTLEDSGVYVLEDLHTAYLSRSYGGNHVDTHDPKTSIGMLMERIDGLNYQYIPKRDPAPLDSQIRAVCFHAKIAFVYKGANVQELSWNDRRALDLEIG